MIIQNEEVIDNADFRSERITALLNESDIVISNPPFSLWRSFFAWVIEAGKSFLLVGNLSACTYKNVFPYIRDKQCWLGVTNRRMNFLLPDTAEKYDKIIDGKKYSAFGSTCWYTNIEHAPFPPLQLKTQAELEAEGVVFRRYDNYDAIEVPKVAYIPSDYSEERIVDEAEYNRLLQAGYTVEILEVIDDETIQG
ncbi:MAG: hypothetical protein IJG38_05055 [Thermoguttaceae bacterium]|nr:hypothetical protein [Thermoguttaceae bacterium]